MPAFRISSQEDIVKKQKDVNCAKLCAVVLEHKTCAVCWHPKALGKSDAQANVDDHGDDCDDCNDDDDGDADDDEQGGNEDVD
eukprot:2555787-Karenia_brevis.AAC.1